MVYFSKVGDSLNNVLDHKCPSCDAVLKFNPEGQNWACEYCKKNYNLDELNTHKEGDLKKTDLDIYTCPNCGAEVIVDPNISTTSCIYCKNTTILRSKFQGEFSPRYIIPFKKTKKDAIKAFKNIRKGRILTPKEFNNSKNIKEMSGVYIPFWLYDYDAKGMIETECKKITTWKNGEYKYEKTDTYLVTRGGDMSFNKIPVDGSKKFQDDIMNSIEPFKYEELKKFNYAYLSGFLSEKYDISKGEAETIAQQRAKNSFIRQMKNDIMGFDEIGQIKHSINLNNKDNSYVLLPVWMLNIKYKDKIYTFAMNGQTGKIVGNIPVDKKKAILIWVMIFLLTFTISFALSYFGVIR